MIKKSPNKKLISLKRQPLVLLIFSSISFLLILFRLIFLQLLNHESYKKMSDENRIRLIASQPIRGRILDKNGYVLADSRVKYSLIITIFISSFIGWSLGISQNSCNPYFENNIDQLN